MPWRQAPRNPRGFADELAAVTAALRKHARRLRRAAAHGPATRQDMREARLRAAEALEAMADLGDNRIFADFGHMPAGQMWHPEGDPTTRR